MWGNGIMGRFLQNKWLYYNSIMDRTSMFIDKLEIIWSKPDPETRPRRKPDNDPTGRKCWQVPPHSHISRHTCLLPPCSHEKVWARVCSHCSAHSPYHTLTFWPREPHLTLQRSLHAAGRLAEAQIAAANGVPSCVWGVPQGSILGPSPARLAHWPVT